MRLPSVALLGSTALLGAVPALCSPAKQSCAQPDLTVEIESGIVHGIVDSANPDVRQFLGIPYAKPPVGDLRWAPSEAVEPFGEINATALPPACMQYLSELPSIWVDNILQFNLGGLNGTTGPISEDCLKISVWAPRGAKKNLPVLVWIHGGSFITGGSNVPYQTPTQWVQRTQDHIVVSIQYRVNIFGFPNSAALDIDKQNLGLLDQRLAVEWVRDNIAAFGGDVDRIGLWGQSAGAISVAYYSYTYPEDPIVSALLMDSGNEYLDITSYDTPQSNFTFLASQFGCSDLEPAEELACMKQVDAYAIEDFLHSYIDNGTVPTVLFAPITDEKTVFSDFYARAINGNVATVPTLLGSTKDDGVPFVTYTFDGVNASDAYAVTTQYFFCPAFKSANNRIAAGAPVFRYEYAGNFSNISPEPWMGAWHNSELPLLFGTLSNYRSPATALENETSIAMQDAWLSLVSGGEVGTLAQAWPLYNRDAGSLVREFGAGVAAQTTTYLDWESTCPDALQP